MRVFISWSGEASKAMALGLHRFIQQVLGRADPWMSEPDIAVGTRWPEELREGLAGTGYCVICVTRENVEKPWLNYEAGVIRDGLNKPTAPWMLDITPADFPTLPLNPLQGRVCSREGTLQLVKSINDALGTGGKSAAIIEDLFEKCWPELEEALSGARNLLRADGHQARPEREMIAELVMSTRLILDQIVLGSQRSIRYRTNDPNTAKINAEALQYEQLLLEKVIEFLEEQPNKRAPVSTILAAMHQSRHFLRFDERDIYELTTRYPHFDAEGGEIVLGAPIA
jgi:hypothetical protein